MALRTPGLCSGNQAAKAPHAFGDHRFRLQRVVQAKRVVARAVREGVGAGIGAMLKCPSCAMIRRRGRRRALPFGSSCSALRRRWRPHRSGPAGFGRAAWAPIRCLSRAIAVSAGFLLPTPGRLGQHTRLAPRERPTAAKRGAAMLRKGNRGPHRSLVRSSQLDGSRFVPADHPSKNHTEPVSR